MAEEFSQENKNSFKKIIYPETYQDFLGHFLAGKYFIGERFHFLLIAEFFHGKKVVFLPRKSYAEKVANLAQKKDIKLL